MGISNFFESARRVLHVASKPTRAELYLVVRISLLGIAIMGVVGFIVKVLFWIVGLGA